MKIVFDDGSFIDIDKSDREDKVVSLVMCGLNYGGKKLSMSSSELDLAQTIDIIEFLKKIIKNCS